MSKIKSDRTVRHYDEDFKRRTVNLYKTGDKSYHVLASELGIPASTLAGWVANPTLNMSGSEGTEVEATLLKENKAMKRELASVREERDILKKALAIFSSNGQSK